MLSVAKKVKVDYAHALSKYNGKCRNIHGHTSTIICYFTGHLKYDTGMIVDFTILKEILNKTLVDVIDHSLILNEYEPKSLIEELKNRSEKILLLPFEPTSERLVLYFYDKISEECKKYDIYLTRIEWHETEGSFAVYEPK